jgi:hypothetical protein
MERDHQLVNTTFYQTRALVEKERQELQCQSTEYLYPFRGTQKFENQIGSNMMETRLGRRTSSDFGDPKKLIPEAKKESLTKYERYP